MRWLNTIKSWRPAAICIYNYSLIIFGSGTLPTKCLTLSHTLNKNQVILDTDLVLYYIIYPRFW